MLNFRDTEGGLFYESKKESVYRFIHIKCYLCTNPRIFLGFWETAMGKPYAKYCYRVFGNYYHVRLSTNNDPGYCIYIKLDVNYNCEYIIFGV